MIYPSFSHDRSAGARSPIGRSAVKPEEDPQVRVQPDVRQNHLSV